MKRKRILIFVLMACIVTVSGCSGIYYRETSLDGAGGKAVVSSDSPDLKPSETRDGEGTEPPLQEETPLSEPTEEIVSDIEEEQDPWGVELVREHLATVYAWSHQETDPLSEMKQDSLVLKYKPVIDRLIVSFPGMTDVDAEVFFAAQASREQFLGIDWEKYEFDVSDSTFIGSSENYLFGNVYLKNSSDMWKTECPALFIQFLYKLETQQLVIIETVAAKTDILDYNVYLDDEGTGNPLEMVTFPGVRLLDRTMGPAKSGEFTPVPGLEGDEMCRYIERIFLELCRYPENLSAFDEIFSEETQALLETLEIYYEKPWEVYDWAQADRHSDDRGDVLVTSQFPPSAWNSFPEVGIEFYYTYDSKTGQIQIEDGSWMVFEN